MPARRASCTRTRSPPATSPTRWMSCTATTCAAAILSRGERARARRGRGAGRHLGVGALGREAELPGVRRRRRAPARRRALLTELRRGHDPPGLRGAAEGGMTAHQHEGHTHGVSEDADARRLARGLALIVVFMAAEIVAGILAHSLALLSDAAHMLTDAGALLLSIAVLRLVRRPAGGNVTFGLRRLEALSAQANGALLLVLAGLIVYGGIHRLVTPPSPGGLTIVVVAAVGLVVNLFATRELARANRESLNVEGAFQHLLTDLFAFVATGTAGAVILATGYGRADGIAALLIAAIMIRAGGGLLLASGRVLLEIAPERVSVDTVGRELARYPQVAEVHDLHVWAIGSGFPALSAHVLVDPDADCHGIRRELERILLDRFSIEHTTLQVDHAQAELLQIRHGEPAHH